ncbi:unnamed protein product (macronuclear) [Paramecium tetraurelia]|uniref:Protein kinase domain-containing protein n=1 Tax=Paramecium tetraurelia TaxID=5888 RepID=A0D3K5_PARTE|nr:uncharacterized protein GSPATT00013110001 [Paramecium tetraurelia]CAK77622.1 unnamed protein product [Paramecium tetraurelia]|eukprot:XP_001445019.1 hypothetical protein (macronuclear) [Paramecium tetraurelia strain d4-2]
MGAEQSVAQGIVQSKNFKILGYKENEIYGSFKLIESQSKQYAMISKTCQSYEEYTSLCKILNETKSLNEIDHLVKLVEVDTQEETNLCSTFYKVTALFEYYDITLRQICKQASINCLFVLKGLTETLSKLYGHNIVHGNLTPDHVLIERIQGQIKLNNCTQLTGYNHYKRILSGDSLWYLSPELLAALGAKELRPQYNHEKNEVFQLGLIALEFWGCGNIQEIYDKQNYKINEDVIQSMIEDFGVRNGQVLKNVVKQMLEADPNCRPTMTELNQSFIQLFQIQQQVDEPKVEQYEEQENQYEQTTNLQEINKETYKIQDEVLQVHKESFQYLEGGQSNTQKNENSPRDQFEESPKKVEKQSGEFNIQSVKSSVNQSMKEYYVTGSIAAQFGQLHLLENNEEQKCGGITQLQENGDVLQEKSQNHPTSPKGQDSIKPKKSVKVNTASANKKGVSIKRPKHEIMDTKLPKQAVVVTKKR